MVSRSGSTPLKNGGLESILEVSWSLNRGLPLPRKEGLPASYEHSTAVHQYSQGSDFFSPCPQSADDPHIMNRSSGDCQESQETCCTHVEYHSHLGADIRSLST